MTEKDPVGPWSWWSWIKPVTSAAGAPDDGGRQIRGRSDGGSTGRQQNALGEVVETIAMTSVWALCQPQTVTMATSAGVGNGRIGQRRHDSRTAAAPADSTHEQQFLIRGQRPQIVVHQGFEFVNHLAHTVHARYQHIGGMAEMGFGAMGRAGDGLLQ